MDLPILPDGLSDAAADLLLRLDWWLLSGPAGTVLSSSWGIPVLCVLIPSAIKAGAELGAKYDRLTDAARTGVTAAALTVACLAQAHRVPADRPADHHEVA